MTFNRFIKNIELLINKDKVDEILLIIECKVWVVKRLDMG